MDRKRLVIIFLCATVLFFILLGIYFAAKTSKMTIQGQLEVESVDVASKVPGRIAQIHVSEGDQVDIGSPLISMNSPEIEAKMKQARSVSEAASAVAQKAENGARPQEVEMAKMNWKRAQAAADLAYKSYDRVNRLANEGLLSQQKRDEAYTNHVASRDLANAAKAQYEMAKIGARDEDISAAKAQAAQAEGVVDEAKVAEEEANLKSPVKGEVAEVIGKEGEIIPAGVAVVTVIDLSRQYLLLNVREDQLKQFIKGAEFEGYIPALSDKKNKKMVKFKVTKSSVLPDFATWKATKEQDNFDLKTYEVRAVPIEPIENIRPGMSVLIQY